MVKNPTGANHNREKSPSRVAENLGVAEEPSVGESLGVAENLGVAEEPSVAENLGVAKEPSVANYVIIKFNNANKNKYCLSVCSQ